MGVFTNAQSLQRIVFAAFYHLNHNWSRRPLKQITTTLDATDFGPMLAGFFLQAHGGSLKQKWDFIGYSKHGRSRAPAANSHLTMIPWEKKPFGQYHQPVKTQ